MIKKLKLEEFAAFLDLSGQVDVCLAGSQVAGRVVVGNDDGACIRFDRRAEDQFRISNGRSRAPRRDFIDTQDPVGPVQEQHLELLNELEL